MRCQVDKLSNNTYKYTQITFNIHYKWRCIIKGTCRKRNCHLYTYITARPILLKSLYRNWLLISTRPFGCWDRSNNFEFEIDALWKSEHIQKMFKANFILLKLEFLWSMFSCCLFLPFHFTKLIVVFLLRVTVLFFIPNSCIWFWCHIGHSHRILSNANLSVAVCVTF